MTIQDLKEAKTIALFLAKIVIDEKGCWNWQGGNTGYGYGIFWANGRRIVAHRYSYETFIDKIPAGLEPDHLCRNRKCVNPNHLEAVTHQENCRRGTGLITHCPKGHPYDEINTYINPKGFRRCRICVRAHDRVRDKNKHRRERRLLEKARLLVAIFQG